MSAPPDAPKLLAEIEQLVTELEGLKDTRAREKARAVVRALLELHGAGLERMREMLESRGREGWLMLEQWARDPLVECLLQLHGVHPDSLEKRVGAGLEKVQTYLRLNASRAELLRVGKERVSVRILRGGAGCHATPERLSDAVREALVDRAPEVDSYEIEVVDALPASASVEQTAP